MDEKFIRDRITELRLQKDVPERKMSIELGHSTSYIHSIASGRALPSMPEFLYICDYLGAVSYTHLDVYKRQLQQRMLLRRESAALPLRGQGECFHIPPARISH